MAPLPVRKLERGAGSQPAARVGAGLGNMRAP